MTKRELKNGKVFHFSNEIHQHSIEGDDIRTAEVSFRNEKTNTWANGFNIEFNGLLIHSCKTFKSLENRLKKLKEKWHLDLKGTSTIL